MSSVKLIPINLRIPENLLIESDKIAKLEGSSRTELVRTALRAYLEKKRNLQLAFKIVEKRGIKAGINTPEDIQKAIDEVRLEMSIEK